MADGTSTPRTPARLSKAGRALWRRLVTEFELGPGELALLELAAHQADDVAALEDLLRRDGLIVPGSMGQPRLSAVVAEVRQGRLALAKLVGALALPDEDDRPQTERSKRAAHAANARWSKVRQLDQRRAALRG
jgi:hypothetical protein